MEPNPLQALVLWRMLTAETPELQEPTWTNVKPKLSPTLRNQLIKFGYITSEKRRANHLVLADKAWVWAASTAPARLPKSPEGTQALEGLLHCLIPYLKREGIPLSDVLRRPGPAKEAEKGGKPPPPQLQSTPVAITNGPPSDQVLAAIRSLAGTAPTGAVRMTALRSAVGHLQRAAVDQALRALRDAQLIILYQDDDRASLTPADHDAALMEAATPRHLVYLENR